MELHREIAHWLDQFKVIPTGSPALRPDSSLSDLVAVLRDGVVLCQLVHSLDPSSVDMTQVICEDGSGRSVSDFLCRNNIFLFLHAVVANFELSEEQLFKSEDLYLCQNIGKVFRTLSELSHSSKLSQSGVAGFPKKEKSLLRRLKSEQANYEALNEMYGEAGTEYVYDSFSGPSSTGDKSRLYDNSIYQTIFPPKKERLSLADISFGSAKRKSRRAAPIEELVKTEDKYLENLIMVRDVFRENLSLMNGQDKSAIFHRLDDLVCLHTDLLFDLKTPKKADIGRVFLRHMPRVSHVYAAYCVNLPRAVARLQQVIELSAQVKRQLAECQAKAVPASFPLSSHLVLPFQRFLKYHLLLKEILKRTPEDHPDHGNLSLATDEIVRAGEQVNEHKRDHEEAEAQDERDEADMRLILSVASTIKLMRIEAGFDMLDYGRLRRAADATSYTDNGRVGDYAFLFDLIIVLCTRPKWLQHRYRFREAVKVRDHLLERPQADPDSNVFALRLRSRADARRIGLTLILKSEPDRQAWFDALLAAMETVTPGENAHQGHVIQLTTFADPVDCFQCGKALRGRFFQGYRCLRCQACLHKACLADCPCLEVGAPLRKSNSLMLPTAIPDCLERSGSTLSLADGDARRNSQAREFIEESRTSLERERENLPVERQPWFAGAIDVKTASNRLESLPVGTFLVRKRANGQFALMLKSPEKPRGVKSMKIEEDPAGSGDDQRNFYLSQARKFPSLARLVSYYRAHDLTENFNYEALRGVVLKTPYKDI